jgi:hypothetical protein
LDHKTVLGGSTVIELNTGIDWARRIKSYPARYAGIC